MIKAQAEIIEVHGLYARSWKGVLNEASFVHPAKISFNLAEYIYRFAMERDMLKAGDSVLDPFGGIGGTAFHAMVFGMNWIGTELEQKFVDLGQANIEAWNKKYASTLPNWGSASLVQGDSRKLGEVLLEKCNVSISSPPYADQEKGYGDRPNRWEKVKDNPNFKGRTHWKENDRPNEYGSAHGQLGNLPEGKLQETLDVAISSPPYSEQYRPTSDKEIAEHLNQAKPKGGGAFKKYDGSQSEGNLAALDMTEGFDAAISSPPYASARIGETSGAEQVGHGANYGGEVGQLGGMAEGTVDAVISSPPYADSINAEKSGIDWSKTHRENGTVRDMTKEKGHATRIGAGAPIKYGDAEGQLGGLKDEGFDEVVFDVAVSSPPFTGIIPSQANQEWHQKRASIGKNNSLGTGDYGKAEGQLANLPDTGFDNAFNAALSSPPYLASMTTEETKDNAGGTAVTTRYQRSYGNNKENLGNQGGDTFWSASKTIVSQVHNLLKPNGYAFWVVKNFVRKKQIVDFVGQWQQLCEACGFETLYEIRAWQVDEHGTQQGMEGQHKKLSKSKKSFFRRLAEKNNPAAAIDYEVVLVMRKTGH